MTFKNYLKEAFDRAKIAKKLGLDVTELKYMSDQEIEIILKDIGKHDFKPDSDFNPKELELGIKHEYEHTKSKLVAKLIAKDHLIEDTRYYSKLNKIDES